MTVSPTATATGRRAPLGERDRPRPWRWERWSPPASMSTGPVRAHGSVPALPSPVSCSCCCTARCRRIGACDQGCHTADTPPGDFMAGADAAAAG